MSKKEGDVVNDIRLAASAHNLILFRNNVGKSVIGRPIKFIKKSCMVWLNHGDAVVKSARWIDFGLMKGSSDLIGLEQVVITPEMVGQTIGIFTGLECKTETGNRSPEQETFERVINAAGGRVRVVRGVEDMPSWG